MSRPRPLARGAGPHPPPQPLARSAEPREPPRPPTRGPHFFVPPADVDGHRAVVRGDDAHHLARVLRAAPGDPVSVADGRGAVWQGRIEALGGDVAVALGQRWDVPWPRPSLTVVQALPKGRKLDDVVLGLSQVGVDRLVPAASGRSEVRLSGDRAARMLRRWRAVALAAAKQARRARVMAVDEPRPWAGAVAPPASGAVLWEEAAVPLRDALEPAGASEVVLAIGPEGGLEPEEVRASGLVPASLGAPVLRTETAAVVAAALVLARLGRLG